MKNILVFLLLFIGGAVKAQETTFHLYKGTVDGLPVTLFLKAEYNGCTADAFYQGMYQYDKKSTWLQVYPTRNDKNQFVMVEYGFSGVMILQKTGKNFTGTWISPDTKRQLKVVLKEMPLNKADKEKHEKKLEEVNYENHDC